MYLSNQIFLVLGLSRSGRAAAEFLLTRNATVFIYDDLTGERVEQIAELLEKRGAKRMKKEDLATAHERCDVLVLSPGIPIDHPLAIAFKRGKKAVVGETELAARYMRCPVVAITGTNGKTTTVSMLTDVLNKGGILANSCGNIGTPMIDFCETEKNSIAVAEISSFQLETLNSLCPHVAIVLNISEDHLNRHYNMENYIFLKAKLLRNSSEAEFAVLNYDDSIVRGTTCVRVVKLLRDAGATEIHIRSSAPAFLNPCYYGTDIGSKDELIACKYTPDEMAKLFGADSVGFLPLEDVTKLGESGTCKGYCKACFDGVYPTDLPKDTGESKYDYKISENKN